jgi:transposase
MEERGVDYIVAARLRQLPRELRQRILSSPDFTAASVNNEFHWVKEFTHRDRRLVVSYSSSRAKKDVHDRSRLVERLLKKVKDGKVRVSAVIPNYGSKKFLRVKNGEAEVDHDKIAADELWDGLHGVISNCRDLTPTEILGRYRGLWQIEESFRVSKHDLKMRPIYHWTPERIRAHILICFMAFAVAKQAVYRMSLQQFPLSFEQMRNELLHVQSSIVSDISTKKRYLLPSKLSLNQQKIYQAFGLKRSVVPCACPR